MSKKRIIILILFILSFLLIFYLILASGYNNRKIEAQKNVTEEQTKKKISHEGQLLSYQSAMKKIISDYSDLIDSLTFATNTPNLIGESDNAVLSTENYSTQLASIKNEMMEVVVPSEYRELHMNLFLSMISLEKYLNSADEDAKEESLAAWRKIKEGNNLFIN